MYEKTIPEDIFDKLLASKDDKEKMDELLKLVTSDDTMKYSITVSGASDRISDIIPFSTMSKLDQIQSVEAMKDDD